MQPKPTREDYRRYLDENVNCIIKPLIVDLLRDRPDGVIDYILEWGLTRGREIETQKEAQDQKKIELTDPNVEREVRRSLRLAEDNYSDSHLPESDDGEDDEEIDDDDDAISEKNMKKPTTKKKNAISAEAYGDYNKLGDFKPRFLEKTDQQVQKIQMTLMKSFMFNSLEKHDQNIIVGAMKIQLFKNGDTVIKQGDDGDELFIIGSGKLRCCKKLNDNPEEVFLKNYEPGEVFGELALLYNAPRAASVYAEDNCELYSLDRDTFNHIVKNSTIQRRQKYEEFIQKIEILKDLDSYERQKICDCLTTEEFKKGDFVIKEGEEGYRFYLVQQGTAEAVKLATQGHSERVFEYKENDYFGELALLNGDKRKASIMVTSDKLVVASLAKDSFKRLLGPIEKILERNKSKYDKYVKQRAD